MSSRQDATIDPGERLLCDSPGCDQSFRSTGAKMRHMKERHGNTYYSCSVCLVRYARSYKVQKHIDRNHPGMGAIVQVSQNSTGLPTSSASSPMSQNGGDSSQHHQQMEALSSYSSEHGAPDEFSGQYSDPTRLDGEAGPTSLSDNSSGNSGLLRNSTPPTSSTYARLMESQRRLPFDEVDEQDMTQSETNPYPMRSYGYPENPSMSSEAQQPWLGNSLSSTNGFEYRINTNDVDNTTNPDYPYTDEHEA